MSDERELAYYQGRTPSTPRKPEGEGTCRSCKATILWVEMVPSGKPTPLDAVPRLDGNVERKQGNIDRSKWYGRVVPRAERKEGQRLYVVHHSTCPQGKNWRR